VDRQSGSGREHERVFLTGYALVRPFSGTGFGLVSPVADLDRRAVDERQERGRGGRPRPTGASLVS
jgi:hypothetical protein